jgi:2'-5' RNA ligase
LYPARETVGALLEVLRGQGCGGGLADHRETPAEQVHMTLQFIGERRKQEVDGVIESVERSASGLGAFELKPTRLISLPERGRARLVACATDEPPALMELQRRLAQRLARSPRARPGDRFTPHLTLCRYSKMARPSRLETELDLPPFAVTEIKLMRSVLMPSGAEHRVVRAVGLSGS